MPTFDRRSLLAFLASIPIGTLLEPLSRPLPSWHWQPGRSEQTKYFPARVERREADSLEEARRLAAARFLNPPWTWTGGILREPDAGAALERYRMELEVIDAMERRRPPFVELAYREVPIDVVTGEVLE